MLEVHWAAHKFNDLFIRNDPALDDVAYASPYTIYMLMRGSSLSCGSEQFRIFFNVVSFFYDVIQRAIVMFYSFVGWYNDDDDGWEEACRGAVQIEW